MEYPLEWNDFPCSPVVGFVGLKDLHTQIAQNFHTQPVSGGSGSPSSQVLLPLYALSLDPQTPLPPHKDRRQSFEGQPVDGVLKYLWARKHTRELPIAIAALFDWDEDPAGWRQRETDVANQIEALKANFSGRKVKLIVVLVQNRRPAPGDSSSDERVSSLKKRADIEGKSIITLGTYEMRTSCGKLEKALWDAARSVYKDEARRIKKMKERVSRSTQPLKYVRVHAKIAFYAEVRREYSTALKYYVAAYKHVSDLTSSTRVTLQEVKTVAEVLSLKICNIHLTNGNVSEALDQFQRHISHFKKWTGANTVYYQHLAWLSRQYMLFGDLIEAAAPASDADELRRPGYYYQAAAAFATERKEVAEKAIAAAFPDGEIPVFEVAEEPKYLGRLPTIIIHSRDDSAHPLEAGADSGSHVVDDAMTLALLETQVDHSSIIIDLLTRAYEQFKQHSARRVVLSLASKMATAYANAGKYDMARRFFDRIVTAYRKERWSGILSHILTRALECAEKLNEKVAYATYLTELIVNHVEVAPKTKTAYQKSLIEMLQVDYSSGDDKGKPTAAHAQFGKLEAPIEIAMVGMATPLVLCRVHAVNATTAVQEPIHIRVLLELHAVSPLTLDKLEIEFSNSDFNTAFEDPDELSLEPLTPIVLDITKTADQAQSITCTRVVATWGKASACVIMEWVYPEGEDTVAAAPDASSAAAAGTNPAAGGTSTSTAAPPAPHVHSHHGAHHAHPHTLFFDPARQPGSAFVERRTFTIVPAPAQLELSVSHAAPALVHEFLRLDLALKSPHAVIGGSITPVVQERSNAGVDMRLYTAPAIDSVVTGAIPFDALEADVEMPVTLYARTKTQGEQRIAFRVDYTAKSGKGKEGSSDKVDSFTVTSPTNVIPFVLPFNPLFRFLPSQHTAALPRSELSKANTSEQLGLKRNVRTAPLILGDPVLLHVELQAASVPGLELSRVELIPADSTLQGHAGHGNEADDEVVMGGSEKFTSCFRVVPTATGSAVSLGEIQIVWRREGVTDAPPSTMALPLPPVVVDERAFSVVLNYPPQGEFGTPLELSLTLRNNTQVAEAISVSLQENEAFLFTGLKAVTVRVLPHDQAVVSYRLVPVAAGSVILPRFQVRSVRFEKDILSTQNRTIFIRPAHSG